MSFPCGEGPALGAAKPITNEVQWLRFPLPLSSSTINVWALRDGDGWALVDTGMYTDEALAVWRLALAEDGPLSAGLTRIFGTHHHADHVGIAGWLTRHSDCELWMTRTEYQSARLLFEEKTRATPPEIEAFYRRAGWGEDAISRYRSPGRQTTRMPESFRRLRDGDTVRIGEHDWHVITGNGHSPEHACLHCPTLRLLLSGDQVLPLISSNVSVPPTEPNADPLNDWLTSLARLRERVPDDVLVLPAHDAPFHGLHARLDSLARKRHGALARLRTGLKSSPRRAVDTFEFLFGRPDIHSDFLRYLATGEALAYLNYLVLRSEARVVKDEQGVNWYELQH